MTGGLNGFSDFSGFNAFCADIFAKLFAVYKNADLLKVRHPDSFGFSVAMADIIAYSGQFSANKTLFHIS